MGLVMCFVQINGVNERGECVLFESSNRTNLFSCAEIYQTFFYITPKTRLHHLASIYLTKVRHLY